MKYIKPLLFLFFVFAIIQCNSISVVRDNFKNLTIVSMPMDHDSKFENSFFNRKLFDSADSKYVREIKDGKTIKFTYFGRFKVINIERIEKEAFVQIDNNNIKVAVNDVNLSQEQSVQQKTPNYGAPQTPGTAPALQTVTTNYLNLSISIPVELEEKVLKANQMAFRVYSKDLGIDLLVSKGQLKKIKEFIATKDSR